MTDAAALVSAEIAEGRRRYAERKALTVDGPCRICGMFGVNVVHDPPDYRAWQVEHVYKMDYYAWAEVGYHPFEAETETP